MELSFPLEGLVICSECQCVMQGEVRLKNGEPVGMYCCPEHRNLKYESQKLEQIVLARGQELFTQMMKTNLHLFLERYQTKNEEKLNKNLTVIQKKLTKREKQLMNRTEQWLQETDEERKVEFERKLKHYKETVEEQRSLERELNDLYHHIQEIGMKPKRFLQQIDAFLKDMRSDTDAELMQRLMKDIVSQITVSRHCIDIQFKHPYIHSMEVFDPIAE